MAIALVASVAVVALAATILFDHVHETISLPKDNYVKVQLTGVSASGSIKPGDTVSAAPVLTNGGSVNAVGFLVLTVPVVDGTSAYDFGVNSSWTEIDSDPTDGVYVYSYGSESELTVISPDSSTDPLTDGFTMKSSISGSQFNAMTSVDIEIDGYLLDASQESDPGRAWDLIPKQ